MALLKLFLIVAICRLKFVKSSFSETFLEEPLKVDLLVEVFQNITYDTIVFVSNDAEIRDVLVTVYAAQTPIINIDVNILDNSTLDQVELLLGSKNLYVTSLPGLTQIEETILNLKTLQFWKARDPLLFIIQSESASVEDISQSFRFCMDYWVINVVVIFLYDFQAYTYNPFTDNYAIKIQILSNLFPDKTRNLFGFFLNISLFNDDIYATKVGEDYVGKDGLTAKTVLDAINATYSYVSPDDDPHPFRVARNTLGRGLTQILFNARFSAISDKTKEDTYPSDRNDVVVLVPLSDSNYRNAYFKVSPFVWILVLCIGVSLFVYLRKAGKIEAMLAVIIIIHIILGKPIREIKVKYFRMVFMSSMIVAFYILTDFNCMLTSVLTVSNAPEGVKSLLELSKVEGKIKTRRGINRLLITALKDEIREGIQSKIEVMEDRLDVGEISKCTYDYYVCKKETAEFALWVELMQNRRICYRIMEETVLGVPTNYAVYYGSPFLDRVNELVQRIVESGLLAYWKRNATSNVHKWKTDFTPSKLTLGILRPGIYLLVAGLTLATVAFGFELIWFRYKNNN